MSTKEEEKGKRIEVVVRRVMLMLNHGILSGWREGKGARIWGTVENVIRLVCYSSVEPRFVGIRWVLEGVIGGRCLKFRWLWKDPDYHDGQDHGKIRSRIWEARVFQWDHLLHDNSSTNKNYVTGMVSVRHSALDAEIFIKWERIKLEIL